MRYLMGIGNYSMFDDSIGIRIVEHISENKLDNDFLALDMSGNLINILNYFNKDTDKILIIDTVKMGLKAGVYKIFEPESVVSKKQMAGISTHEGDFMKILALAKEMNSYIPPLKILGIEPSEMKNEFGLSNILKNEFENYLNVAINEIGAN